MPCECLYACKALKHISHHLSKAIIEACRAAAQTPLGPHRWTCVRSRRRCGTRRWQRPQQRRSLPQNPAPLDFQAVLARAVRSPAAARAGRQGGPVGAPVLHLRAAPGQRAWAAHHRRAHAGPPGHRRPACGAVTRALVLGFHHAARYPGRLLENSWRGSWAGLGRCACQDA